MAIPGEVIGAGVLETQCDECGKRLTLRVLRSGAGHYLGFFCPTCGPWSRESGYYPTEAEAQKALGAAQLIALTH